MSAPTRTVVANGTVVDGFGGVPWVGDVLISGGRIEALVPGGSRPESGYDAAVVDATGHVVSPGFVDIHCHSDLTRFAYPVNESRITQGITTEVVGNCGMSAAPTGNDARTFASLIATIDVTPETPRPWSTVSEWLDALDRTPSTTNVAALVGHGSARHTAAGQTTGDPTIQATARVVREALDTGCVGASLGLMYAPGESAPPEELRAIGEEVASAGALFAAHLRDYRAAAIRGSVAEVVEASGGARIQISHLRATSPEPGFADILEHVESLRDRFDIAADCYPYIAGHTTLVQILPSSVRAGGPSEVLKMGSNPSLLAALLEASGWRPDQIIIMKAARSAEAVGDSPVNHSAPWAWLADLLLSNDGLVDVAVESGFWRDVDSALRKDWVTIGSDGTALSPDHQISAPHPRSWGAFPAAFRRMRDNGIGLATAVRRMSVASAERVRVPSGLRPGAPADIAVFDELTFDSDASFGHPARPATGLLHVFVNGRQVVANGRPTSERPGRLRRAGETT
ncbi:amidohydrolase family protein [Microbacterium sp. TPD7012]|uniref:N-acyl-D-amino-acid deacylase family protein n=1 Tax=Microbacterium sp. TPD7012 TaxID=2171975 RepID=UPI00140236B0|nr:amidohydrolase family protein [Microbacterium sp. TPD7012]